MADTHSVSLDIPNTVGITLRGFARSVDTTKLPAGVLVALLEKGIQRGSNDPLGALFEKGATVAEADIDKYFTELTERWAAGNIAKTRTGGLGRTTDPVKREVKRLANAEVDSALPTLLAHHGAISRKEFDEQFRAKYVAARIEKHSERLTKEANANLAKLAKAADMDLLDI